ncbi:MAG TPA: DUF1343 domain-containing protein [Candidatus Hydrogenedentes bacterium]|nr:DUF1343 domain-containing protein [Candidatus Hydrogenedentota bacterium]
MSRDWQTILDEAVRRANAPGAVACIGARTEDIFLGASGLRQRVPNALPVSTDTVYDLASLTKVVATTTAAMLLRDDGLLELDAAVSDYLPVPEFHQFTVRHLITHMSGLPPHRPFFKEVSTLTEVLQRIARIPLENPVGLRHTYSDLGFMILGKVVEVVAGNSLDAFCRERMYQPLAMEHTTFTPPASWKERCAATEDCTWRKRIILGEVQDENAYAVGGVSGHAGLFSTAGDLARFCRALLQGKILSEKTLTEMTQPDQAPCYPWQGLGWQLDPWSSGSSGFLAARTAFGHTGWTGTSLWMDRDSGLFVILLCNSCHPSREHRDTRTLRQVFYRQVCAEFYPQKSNVHGGLDRIMWNNYTLLRKKRAGLLTNQAAVTEHGRCILDALALDPDVQVVRLFGPEHGLQGKAEAGEIVSDEKSAIPVVSLYGKQQAPTQDQLADLDLFVIDLPDVGARYYTYIDTMKECMSACAKAHIPMLILDRPNPVGGLILEGPIATMYGAPVCCAPIPIRHGMTMGEMALFFRKEFFRGVKMDLAISEVDNWPRDLLFDECALPWPPPSPNIPTPETALAYVGTCLFEGVNINEGRGTEYPFLCFGAPWLDPEAILARLDPRTHAGFTLEPLTYTPRSIPGKAKTPRYMDEECRGLRLHIEHPREVRPFTLATALLCAILATHPGQLHWEKSFDILAGGPWLREHIQRGTPPLDIIASLAPALDHFDAARPKLY